MDPGEILRNLTEGWNWTSYVAGAATPIIGYLALSKYSNWQTNRELRREEAEREREEARKASARRESYPFDRSILGDTFGQSPTYRTPVTTPREPYRTPVTPAREAPKPPVTSPRPVTQPREPYRTPITPAREATRPQLPATPRKPETPALPVDPIEAARKRQRELGNGDKPKQLGSGN